MLAERASASSLFQVLGFDVVPLCAEGIVVGTVSPGREEYQGDFLGTLISPFADTTIHCALIQAGLTVLQKTKRDP